MRFAITGPSGDALRTGRGKAVLNAPVKVDLSGEIPADTRSQWEKSGLVRWTVGDLPEVLTISTDKGTPWQVYPAFERDPADNGTVNLRLFSERRRAIAAHCQAVAVLAAVQLKKEVRYLKRLLKLPPLVSRSAVYFGGAKALSDGLCAALMADLLEKNIRRRQDFEALVGQAAVRMPQAARELLDAVCPVIEAYDGTEQTLGELQAANRFNAAALDLLEALRRQLHRLVPENFFELYAPRRLADLKRYLKALDIRARRAIDDPEKDQARAVQVALFEDALEGLLKSLSPSVSEEKKAALEDFFWLIEEFKVSLFAQEIKTAVKVSPKRLQHRLDELRRMS